MGRTFQNYISSIRIDSKYILSSMTILVLFVKYSKNTPNSGKNIEIHFKNRFKIQVVWQGIYRTKLFLNSPYSYFIRTTFCIQRIEIIIDLQHKSAFSVKSKTTAKISAILNDVTGPQQRHAYSIIP